MDIIDTYSSVLTSYDNSGFSFEQWEKYIDFTLPGLFPILVADVKNVLCTGEFSKEDYLSVLNYVAHNQQQLEVAHNSFLQVIKNLERIIYERFGKRVAAVAMHRLFCIFGLNSTLSNKTIIPRG